MMRPLFITVEGIEGVGKSTAAHMLHDLLLERNIPVTLTREPGGTKIGEQIRAVLLNLESEAMVSMTELLLLFAARAQHIEQVINPALASGQWVVCDRFTDASYAYQGGGREIAMQKIATLEQLVHSDLQPDHTLLLDAPVELGLQRAKQRGELDRIEQEQVEFFNRVRQTYLQLAENSAERFHQFDAAKSLDEMRQWLTAFIDQVAC